jgi:hypothetical protein
MAIYHRQTKQKSLFSRSLIGVEKTILKEEITDT